MISPVEESLVASLARPGGNLTGTVPAFGQETGVKRVELLHELVPRTRNVAYLGTRLTERDDIPPDVVAAATALGLTLLYVLAELRDLETSLREVERGEPDALLVVPTVPLYPYYRTLVAFARRALLPDVHAFQEAVEAGGLASYGGDTYDAWRRTARYVARILDGAKPADLPIEKTDRYRLRINGARTRALGLAIPPVLALRAEIV